LQGKLAKQAATFLEKEGIKVSYLDLIDYPLPIYNGDLEEKSGLPAPAKKLKKLFIEADGVIISSPEYNSSLSALLKNTLDWISRPEETDPFYLVAFKKQRFLLLSASPGALGGLRGLTALRLILTNVFGVVYPDQLSVGNAHKAFSEEGELADPKKRETLLELVKEFSKFCKQLKDR
jgi:chromate reductase, NAD(P)H dehydrogenase (quinone)